MNIISTQIALNYLNDDRIPKRFERINKTDSITTDEDNKIIVLSKTDQKYTLHFSDTLHNESLVLTYLRNTNSPKVTVEHQRSNKTTVTCQHSLQPSQGLICVKYISDSSSDHPVFDTVEFYYSSDLIETLSKDPSYTDEVKETMDIIAGNKTIIGMQQVAISMHDTCEAYGNLFTRLDK